MRGLPPGTYDVIVANPDGQSALLESAYTVRQGSGGAGPAPTLTHVSPSNADNATDTQIALTGANFQADTVVQLNDLVLSSVTYLSPTSLQAIVPRGTPPGVYDVTVVNPDGQMAQIGSAFTLSAGNGVWQLKQGRLSPRFGGAAGVLGDQLYAVAGLDDLGFGRLVETYDPATDVWQKAMDHPGTGGRFLPGSAVLEGKLYTFGGQNPTYGTATSKSYVYDPATGVWSARTEYPLKVLGLAATALNGKIYLFGGEQPPALSNGPGPQYRNVYVYDPVQDTYAACQPLPLAVSRAVALAYGGKIYVIGGLNQGLPYSGVQVYDPAADSWSTAAPLPHPQAEAAGVTLGSKLYTIGGHDGQEVLRAVYEYDPAANAWRTRTPLTTPRTGAFAGTIGGRIYVAGGRSSLQASQPLDTVEEGDLGTAPATPRLYVSAAAHDFGQTETVWEFQVDNLGGGTLNWNVSESPDKPWLSIQPTSGSGAATVHVTVARDGLTAGSYSGDLMVSSNGGQATIHIVMEVVAQPRLHVEPASLVFNVGETSKTLHITNLGGGVLTWNVSSDAAWATPSPSGGTGNADLTISVALNQLPPGESNTWLRITSNGGNADVGLTVYKEQAPALGVEPGQLDFGTDLEILAFEVLNRGGGLLDWEAVADQPWLTLSRSSGQNDGTVQVSVARQGLEAGRHSATITVNGAGQQATVQVSMEVVAQPRLAVSTTLVDLGSAQDSASFEVHNDGGGTLSWDLYEDADWFWLEPTHGENNRTVTIHAQRSGRSPGQKTATIRVDSAFGTAQIEVRMTIEQGPILNVQPTSIDFGRDRSSDRFQILNDGGGTLSWSISGVPAWLSLSRTSGTGEAWIDVTVLRDQMPTGSQQATLQVQGDGQAGQRTVSITAIKEAAPQLEISTTRLDFGDSATSRSFRVSNAGGGTLHWSVSSNKNWIQVSPASGTNDGTVTVTVDRDGQPPGEHSGTVTVQGNGQSKRVTIYMDVQPPQIDRLTVGNVTVRADNFEWLGGEKYKATGNVRFNDGGKLMGSADHCYVDKGRGEIYGQGTVALVTSQGNVRIFYDKFNVNTSSGEITPRMTSAFDMILDEVATFEVQSTFEISVNVIQKKATGKVKIRIDKFENTLQETLTFEIDSRNNLSGSISDLTLRVAGLDLKAERITVSKDGLHVHRAYLKFPASLGGTVSASVNDLVLTGSSPYVQLDTTFEVNNINFGGHNGFSIQHARIDLVYAGGKFKLSGEGTFIFETFGSYGSCQLDVGFYFYSIDNWHAAIAVECTGGVPIGTSGFFITSGQASITFGPNNFEISMGLTIRGGPKVPLIDEYTITGRPDIFFQSAAGNLKLGIKGDVTVLEWGTAYTELYFKKEGSWAGVQGSIQINLQVVRGDASVAIWKDNSGAHFRGDAKVSLVIPEGFIVDTFLIKIPPSDWTLLQCPVSVGEHTKISTGETVYGIRAGFTILGYTASAFVNAKGELSLGDDYRNMQVLAQGFPAADGAATQAQEVVEAEIGVAASALFAFGWDSGAPTLTLIDPVGRIITAATRAPDVQTVVEPHQTLIGIRNPLPGTWRAQIDNLTGSETYELVTLQSNVPPEVQILAPSAPGENGSADYSIQWQVIDPDSPDLTVDLFYAASEEAPRLPIATGLSLAQSSYPWDTSAVASGEYRIYAEVRDGFNAPQVAWSSGTVRVHNHDAPPVPTLASLVLDQERGSALVTWSPVDAPDLEGYRVYYGYQSGLYEGMIDVGNTTTAELLALEMDSPVFVAVTAYDSSGNESALSAERSGFLGVHRTFLPIIRR